MGVEIHLTLTEEEWALFLIMQGLAAGTALRNDDEKLAQDLLRLTNKINAGKPRDVPDAVPESNPIP
jgi:hypothetical protein